jgi:hypothetical protein
MSLRSRPLPVLLLLLAALGVVLGLATWLERGGGISPGPAEGSGRVLFSPPAGEYDTGRLLQLQPTHPRAQVIFATGGTVPTLTVGTLYERPLRLGDEIPGVTAVRARQVVDGVAGPVHSASYVVGLEHELPVLSLIVDPVELWDPGRGLLANPWQRGPEWERPVHVTYFDGEQTFALPAGLRVHGSESFDAPKQSLRLYFRSEYGVSRLEQALFPLHPAQDGPSYKRLLLQAGDRTGRWTLLEEQLLAEVAGELGGHAPHGRFVLLFLNGRPWGVYRLAERIDRFFLEDSLGMGEADLIRDGRIEEGEEADWEELLEWAATHDLADEDNFAAVAAQIDLSSFTDYAILQAYFGFPAEPFSAARPRPAGRWTWLYGGWRATWTPALEPTSMLLDGEGGDLALLLDALLENPDYRARFAGRAADLLNTTLAAEEMAVRIDRLAAALAPDVVHEMGRWPSPAGWEGNVAALHEFAERRPDLLRAELRTALGLGDVTGLSFAAAPQDGGGVYVNGLPVVPPPGTDAGNGGGFLDRLGIGSPAEVEAPDPAWSGSYFRGIRLQVIAVPAAGTHFAGWGDGEMDNPLTITVEGPRALLAHFAPVAQDDPAPRPNDVIFNEVWINDDGTRYPGLDNRPVEGDWLELLVTRARPVDLRGWRITDNDVRTSTHEGSLILPHLPALAEVERGTLILILATESSSNSAYFPQDDLDPSDGRILLYVGNDNLDATTDPGFGIGTGGDNLVLLTGDGVGVDFVAEGQAVTPFSFGVLADGVRFDAPFRGLGADDGVLFTGERDNDGAAGWIVDPPAHRSGDALQLDSTNLLSPGSLNPRQREQVLWTRTWWMILAGLVGVGLLLARRLRAGGRTPT